MECKSHQHTIVQIKDLNTDGRLDFNPEYQRNPVWPYERQSWLIDSLFKNIDIPKIYCKYDISGDREVYEIIDGQQRLYSILGFIDGSFVLEGKQGLVTINNIQYDIRNMKFMDMPSAVRQHIFTSTIDVVQVHNAEKYAI